MDQNVVAAAEKAALDGEYVKKMSFLFDCKCFFGTITSVLKHDGVVEGGTGELKKQESIDENSEKENSENALFWNVCITSRSMF